jgi:hypothetical protein
MPSVLSHMSEKLENEEKKSLQQETFSLLNTIRVPRDLGQITERLPKPQYGNVMRRNKSLPPEKMEKLPEIITAKKESLITASQKPYDSGIKEQTPSSLSTA